MSVHDAEPLISLHDAAFGYAGRAVVAAPSLALRAGQCLGVFGPNGSGKTTLLRGITGTLSPLHGRVKRREGAPVRFGLLSQYRGIDTRWPMSGFDAAAMASSARTRFGRVDAATTQRVYAAMDQLSVRPLAGRSFGTLSGGQQQRLLLAGALAAGPGVLLMDEPTDGLDVRSRAEFLQLLRDLTDRGLCAVLISHDIQDLLAACDDVAWLHPADTPDGASRVDVSPASVFAQNVVAGAAVPA